MTLSSNVVEGKLQLNGLGFFRGWPGHDITGVSQVLCEAATLDPVSHVYTTLPGYHGFASLLRTGGIVTGQLLLGRVAVGWRGLVVPVAYHAA